MILSEKMNWVLDQGGFRVVGEGDVKIVVENQLVKRRLWLKVTECPDCGDPVLEWEMYQGGNNSWCGPHGFISLRTRKDSVLLLFQWIRNEPISDDVWYRELDRSLRNIQKSESQQDNSNTEIVAVARDLYNTLKKIVKDPRSMVMWEDLAKSIRSYRKALSLCCSRMSDEEQRINRRLWGYEGDGHSHQAQAWMNILSEKYHIMGYGLLE